MTKRKPQSEFERLWSKVYIGENDECWPWIASTWSDGYGRIKVAGKMKYSHRRAYRLLRGPIPEGHKVCHTCDNPACHNPRHWFTCTNSQNTRDAVAKKRHNMSRKTHCPGHPYSGENLCVTSRGWRQCRACGRERYYLNKTKALPLAA